MDDETIKGTYFRESYITGHMCQATNGGMQLRIASSVIPLLQTAFSLYSQATDRPLSGENQ